MDSSPKSLQIPGLQSRLSHLQICYLSREIWSEVYHQTQPFTCYLNFISSRPVIPIYKDLD